MKDVEQAIVERSVDLESLGVRVKVVSWMPREMLGAYDADTHTIYLLDSLGLIQARSTLAHELIHARYRHRGRGVQEQEDTAQREAALELVGPVDRIRDAAKDLNLIGALAIALGVMPRDVRSYLDTVPNAGAELLSGLLAQNTGGLRVPRPSQVAQGYTPLSVTA